ncbi:MAG: imidazoleglycerol-phosphate dehydratase HisB [Magnetococcales bacterium]|nr:imidazoleglycerol-phosphate dehydratase HisB [Magnetococcales bacterium]
MRQSVIERTTHETRVVVRLAIDGTGEAHIHTGIGFLDHMLHQLARHGLFDLDVEAEGDLHVDGHHTVEDVAIALGQALRQALGDRSGVQRFGHAYVPLDEALVRVVVDLSNRPGLVWQVTIPAPRLGDCDTELFREWFIAFTNNSAITLHATLVHGSNSHHIVEACFKALARALRQACAVDEKQIGRIPSTKGTLTQ